MTISDAAAGDGRKRDSDALLTGRQSTSPPFITIAIPQYKRRRYLELCLKSIFSQTFSDYEVVVSDDMSPDDSNEVIPGVLERSDCAFHYYAQTKNLGYDGNVRFCLGAAQGRYVMLLGNDDALVAPTTLQEIADALAALDYPEVAITNYEDWQSGAVSTRAYGTKVFGSGADTAIHYFRSFSFVSGLIYQSAEASKHETDKWDNSIYYQIYLACRIVAAGGRLAGLDISAIGDHIRLNGELVQESYQNRLKEQRWSFQTRHTGLDSVARVTIDAVLPYVDVEAKSKAIRQVWQQLLFITYPYWVLEYRRLGNWGWGWGVARDLWPGNRLREYRVGFIGRLRLWLVYLIVSVAALMVPPTLFTAIRHRIAEVVRRWRQAAFS